MYLYKYDYIIYTNIYFIQLHLGKYSIYYIHNRRDMVSP